MRATNAPVTGDGLNITAKIAKDNAAAAAVADTNPTEVEDGYYLFDLATSESNADVLDLYPESVTSGVQVIGVPGRIFTVDPLNLLTLATVEDAIWDADEDDHNIDDTMGELLHILSSIASSSSSALDTASAPYLSVTEFLRRADKRTVAKLCSDTEVPVVEASLASDLNLEAALGDASGELESACAVGGRYTSADLSALTGMAKAKRNRLLTRLTICFLWERRPAAVAQPWYYDAVMDQLDQLAKGNRIFPFTTAEQAGRASEVHDTQQIVDNVRKATSSAYTGLNRMLGRRRNRHE